MNRNYPLLRGITLAVSIVIGLLLIAGGSVAWSHYQTLAAILIITGLIFIAVFLYFSFSRKSSG